MRARAPGKLVLTGAYAVLDGAPALVLAVDRHAVAHADRNVSVPSPEMRAAFGEDPAPHVDTSALFEQGRKLGLGSSAAAVVAALALRMPSAELATPAGRQALFERARHAHAVAQGGGSGVDVAASTFGGLLEFRMAAPAPTPRRWPEGLVLQVFRAAKSVRTASMLALIRAYAVHDRDGHARHMQELSLASTLAAESVHDARDFVLATRRYQAALRELGDAAGADIVPPAFRVLAEAAAAEEGVFVGAGAGGGDVAVFLGPRRPSQQLLRTARRVELLPLRLQRDDAGVRHEFD